MRTVTALDQVTTRSIIWIALFLLLLQPALAAQHDCAVCGFQIEEGVHIQWGRKRVCNKECRQEVYLDQFGARSATSARRHLAASGRATSTASRTTTSTCPQPRWDGYCGPCRGGVAAGLIDPVKDRYRPPKPEPDPVAETRLPEFAPEKEVGVLDGFNMLEVIISVIVGAVFVIAGWLRGSNR